MSTHNIGLYEDFTKIIFELSSNIIKYAPYFFCCSVRLLYDMENLFSFSFRGRVELLKYVYFCA